MKNIAKVIKTVAAVICATALLPFGLLVAQAAPANQYAVVRGVECQVGVNGISGGYRDLAKDEYTIAIKVPAGSKVFAYCQNGQGNVPLTSSPKTVGRDFMKNRTDVDPYASFDRMPAAAPGSAAPVQKPAAKPAKKAASSQTAKPAAKPVHKAANKPVKTVVLESTVPAGSNTVPVRQLPSQPAAQAAPQTSNTQTTTQVVRNDGKVTSATTPSVEDAPAVEAQTKDSVEADTEENKGTVSRDVETEEPATVNTNADASTTTSDNIVDGQQIEASDYASANLSLVDRMGGAGTLVGIVILGLVGAAGAISLARSIILG